MDASYQFLCRRVIKDGVLHQAADPVQVDVLAKSKTDAIKKAKALLEDKDYLLCLQKIEER